MDTLSDNVKLVRIFLACCAYTDRGYKKFIPVSLCLLNMELTIYGSDYIVDTNKVEQEQNDQSRLPYLSSQNPSQTRVLLLKRTTQDNHLLAALRYEQR